MPSGGIQDGQNVAKIHRAAKNSGSLAPLPLNPGDKAGSGNSRIIMGASGRQETWTRTDREMGVPLDLACFNKPLAHSSRSEDG